ncbi:MAG: holo-ACP synthase [Gemmiger sp.]
MIRGIGADLCEIARLEKSLARPAFVEHVFSEPEQALLAGRSGRHRLETAAANFAAKEAFLKAAGTGLGGFPLPELAVLRRENGAPYFSLTGSAAAWLGDNRLTVHLSLSHDGGVAAAFVVLEQTGLPDF